VVQIAKGTVGDCHINLLITASALGKLNKPAISGEDGQVIQCFIRYVTKQKVAGNKEQDDYAHQAE
jgi:hypothetical protein